MARMLVAGGFEKPTNYAEVLSKLGSFLGQQIIEQGHSLLSGGQSIELEKIVTCAAADAATAAGDNPSDRVTTYILQGQVASENCGRILRSKLDNWERIGKKLRYPEPIYNSDVVILLGGWEGTYRAATWARIAGKPIVPIAGFGLASERIYQDEIDEFDTRYADRVMRTEYELLNQVFGDPSDGDLKEFAEEVVSLAERIISPTTAFVVISFSDTFELQSVFELFKKVSNNMRFDCYRVDQKEEEKGQRIIPATLEGIKKSAYVIVDITEAKPNIYYELGFAQGLGKPIVVTAKKGTTPPFDIFDLPIIYWEKLKDFEQALERRVRDIARRLGR